MTQEMITKFREYMKESGTEWMASGLSEGAL